METKENEPLNTDENGRDEQGRFLSGNHGRPKGATNKTTRDLRRFITNFLNEKTNEISDLWETLDDKEKLTLFIHLSRLVLPKPNEDEPTTPNQLKQPVWIIADNSGKDSLNIPNLPDIGNRETTEQNDF